MLAAALAAAAAAAVDRKALTASCETWTRP